jgi:hypothetical protein
MRLALALALLLALPASLSIVPTAEAGMSKADEKAAAAAWNDAAKAAYPGTVWALKDLPVYTGTTMNIPWISPVVEVMPDNIKIETTTVIQGTYAGAKSVWYGVRANDKLTFKEASFDDGVVALAFVGTEGSKGRDTKIKITGATSLADVQAKLDEILSKTDPVDPSWPEDIKKAIANRKVVNGMTKKQVYLSVGEPTSATTQDIGGGKKVDMWVPRTNNGLRIGFANASMEMTNYPQYIKFQDGKTFDVPQTGGVSLE